MTKAAGGPLPSFIGKIAALSGWKRSLVAFAAGLGAAMAQAPFYLLPLMAVSFSILILFLDGARAAARPMRAGFIVGWFFGFGYFLASLYWVGFAFMVQAEQFAWMAPFAVSGLPAFLALFIGAAAALTVRMAPAGWRRIFAFAFFYMIAEYLRGHILTGLPWNLPGQVFAGTAAGAQSAALWGVYGLSLVAVLLAAAPVSFIGERRGLLKGAAIAVGGTALLFAFGAARLAAHAAKDRDDAFVRIVQPNIPQREKIDNDLWERNYRRHIALSSAPGPSTGPIFVLWPENAVPVIDEVKEGLQLLSDALPKNAILVSGAVRRATGEGGRTDYFNAIAVIAETPTGRETIAHYDKHHLVPFGEYLPMEGLLRALGLAQLAPYDEGFRKGKGPANLNGGGSSFAALVCYEAIFPGEIYPKGARPDWIATVTNDSWFGDSAGPRQHFDQARLRTIETGLPMARSANSGVSGLIDGAGRVVARIPLYETGVIDHPLPMALAAPLYARIGDLFFWVLMVLVAGVGFFPRWTRR